MAVSGLDRVVERLSQEFAGHFSRETITRYVEQTAESWTSEASVTTFIPILVQAVARDRLRALA
jgi:arsenate reductase